MTIQWAGQHWQLLGDKALLWLETETLILSDVHLGKAEDFQAEGIAVASQVHETDLLCLEQLLMRYLPKRIFILGDFVHSNRQAHPNLSRAFRELRGLAECEWVLVLGNHDLRNAEKLAQWAFDRIEVDHQEQGILFTHENQPKRGYQVQGHVHPVLKIVSPRDRLRLPCFVVSKQTLLLPAFGEFTGGFEVTPGAEDAVYLVADREIVRWC